MNKFSEKQLKRYLLGLCTPEEEASVETWLHEDPRHADLLQSFAWEQGQHAQLPNRDKQEVKSALLQEIESPKRNSISRRLRKIPAYVLRAAAVILVVATAALGGFYYYSQTARNNEIVYKQRSLPNGQTATIQLSDGSVIQLNSGSTLRYPEKFSETRREVYLQGEAFFTVTENENRPFVVHAGPVQTQVLGTAFNIEAYSDQKVQVAVVEGRVAVSASSNKNQSRQSHRLTLKKNEWVTFQKNRGLQPKHSGNIWEIIAWKDQVLVFNNKPLSEVAHMLERWYGVQIIIEDESLKNIVLNGEHDNVSLEKVLENMQFILDIKYTMSHDTVTIRSSHSKK